MPKLGYILKRLALFLSWLPFASSLHAEPLKVGQAAPVFQLKTQEGVIFDLASRQGKGWTVLYFYPKAGTPGCTTQACAFRDAIKSIQAENAEVYGVSTDSVEDLLSFHQKHKLSFTLLSDADAKITEAYGVKIPILNLAKRWTFLIDPALTIRQINDNVDPAIDAKQVAESLKNLQANP
jgi:thioredoxin-dependent peroxiredoxin